MGSPPRKTSEPSAPYEGMAAKKIQLCRTTGSFALRSRARMRVFANLSFGRQSTKMGD
jgi:hypothetical protein